jgi:hypothetical protein
MSPLAEEILALIEKHPDVVEQVRANASTPWDTATTRTWIAIRIIEHKLERMGVSAPQAFEALGQIMVRELTRLAAQAALAAAIAQWKGTQPARVGE